MLAAPEGYRNGYGKVRRRSMMAGPVELKRPRVRGLEPRFESRLLPLCVRRSEQVSELLPVKRIDYLGPLPADIQEVTVFSAAVHKAAGPTDAAQALLKYLTAPEAASVIRKTGMEPG